MMPRGNPSQTYQEALARLGFAQEWGAILVTPSWPICLILPYYHVGI